MYTLIDSVKATFHAFDTFPLTPSAQLLLCHLMFKDNCFGRTGRIKVTDIELKRASGLSQTAVTDSKRRRLSRHFFCHSKVLSCKKNCIQSFMQKNKNSSQKKILK